MKVVIVGGVAGGATAAARIRRLDERAEILVFERSGYISYANCGLPYYVGDVITDEEELTLQTPESFFARFRITAKTRHEVLSVDPVQKRVLVKNLTNGIEFFEFYDKLLLAPGAKPLLLPIDGATQEGVFTLRTVEDTQRIKAYVKQHRPRSVVLAGGGFIGVELAENLRRLGLAVTVVQRQEQLLLPFDADMAAFIHAEMRKNGVDLLLGHSVTGLDRTEAGIGVRLECGDMLHADMVILSLGVVPDTALASSAGLALGTKGSILVSDKMETSVPDIYAVGDAVQIKHAVSGEDTLMPLAGPANKQGRIAADNICGKESHYRGAMGSAIVKVFGLTAATTGLNEKAAQRGEFLTDKVILSPMSHAGYYPGGGVMTIKVIFEKNTLRLLGAQIVGSEGVDKRIDVLATAIHAGLKATALKDLELAYAPPYSSAKDPVNMVGFMIENLTNGTLKQWHVEEISALLQRTDVTLLDTRTRGEYAAGHIKGFLNIPVDELRDRISEVPQGKPVYVICQSGLRSYIATRILEGNGFTAYNFSGGYRFYATVVREQALAQKALPCGMEQYF